MPESRPIREIHFVEDLPERTGGAAGIVIGGADVRAGSDRSDCRLIPLAPYYQRNETAWKQAFIDWLGQANIRNASLDWWAHTTSAKNFLSSPLGNELFQVQAISEALKETDAERIFVAGASDGQVGAIADLQSRPGSAWKLVDLRKPRRFPSLTLLRLAYQFGRVLSAFIVRRPKHRPDGARKICLFTYVDRNFRDGNDAFFGKLAGILGDHSAAKPLHVAFLHSPYLKTLPKLEASREFEYWPLYAELRIPDLAWAVAQTLRAMTRVARRHAPGAFAGTSATDLFRESLRWDLAKGGYFYNLLVFRSARRLVHRLRPERIIYPFENKSLEKLLLLGARAGHPACRLIGYQHTSITPRHTTFLLAPGEAAITPLPDRVVTVGDVTRDYLETRGNYPAGLFVTGGALRQVWSDPLPHVPRRGRPLRVLLALSSSREELRGAVQLAGRVVPRDLAIEWGIRPHPEFPIQTLPEDLQQWVGSHARDLTGTPLAENIGWCDVVVYVSSTVALEAMMLGRPVVNMRLSDPIDPDPVLDPPAFHFRASDQAGLVSCLQSIADLTESEYASSSTGTVAYVRKYLKPSETFHKECFLG